MKMGRLVVLWIAGFALLAVQGCGTATYNERYQERADELRYAGNSD